MENRTEKVLETEAKIGEQYWVCVVISNNKYTGLSRKLKPTLATVVKAKMLKGCNKLYVETENSAFESNRYGWQDLLYSGYMCKTKEECIEIYNSRLDECAKECKKNMSRKLSDSYKKEVVEKILKHKIDNGK